MRTILTFSTLHQVLAAEKTLRNSVSIKNSVRATPTPPGLGSAICGMSLELLEDEKRQTVLDALEKAGLNPAGVHDV